MNSKVTITELKTHAPRIIRQAEQKGAVTITRRGRPAAFLVSRKRLEAIIETLEIMGNPKAMKAIRAYEKGKARFKNLSCLATPS
jgi:prevent-host-death family protein